MKFENVIIQVKVPYLFMMAVFVFQLLLLLLFFFLLKISEDMLHLYFGICRK